MTNLLEFAGPLTAQYLKYILDTVSVSDTLQVGVYPLKWANGEAFT